MTDISKCTELIKVLILPKIDDGFRKSLGPNDFDDFKVLCDEKVDELRELFNSITVFVDNEVIVDKDFIVLLLIFCGEHCKLSLWTTEKVLSCCNDISEKLFNTSHSCSELFTKDNSKFLKLYLKTLKPYLLKSTWKEYPTALAAFGWALQFISAPYIGDNLELILPTALIAVDDFLVEYKLEGVLFLQHIIRNVTRAELNRCSYDDVIYKALDSSFYLKESSLVADLISCILSLLGKMYQQVPYQKLSHYNNLMENIIFLMKLEGNAILREAYIKALPDVITQMGLPSVCYLKSIIEIIDDYSTFSSTTLQVFQVIEAVLVSCGPAVHLHLENLTFIILKILLNSNKHTPVQTNKIEELCKKNLVKISVLNPEILSTMTNDVKFASLEPKIQYVISSIIDVR